MKTLSVFFNINNNGINQSTASKKFYTHKEYDQAAGDVNRNATKTEVEYERDACEEELYRLRYGIENLLANNEHGDYKGRQRSANMQNPFRTMMNKTFDLHDRKNKSWMDRCTPCCRRWRRNRFNDNVNIPNSYHSRGASESPYPSQFYSDSSSPYMDPNTNQTKSGLRQSISNLFNPNRSNGSDLLRRKGNNDPAYSSLVYKIIEAKALDCLCTGYSKQNTQKEIAKALSEINQRTDENQWDSASVGSSPSRHKSSSSVSSLLSNDQSLSPRSVTSQKSSSGRISPNDSRHSTKSSLKLNETTKSPKKKSKVTIVTNGGSRSSKSNKKKRSSSKNRKNVKSRSKKPRKSPSTTKRRTGSSKKRSSSRTKTRKSSSKSPSRSRSSKKRSSSKRKKVKRKRPKSNNQITDREEAMLQTFIYPQAYQQMYRNQQRILNLLLSST